MQRHLNHGVQALFDRLGQCVRATAAQNRTQRSELIGANRGEPTIRKWHGRRHHARLPHPRQGRPAHRTGRRARRRDRARCCCGSAPRASAARTCTTTSRAATATSSCASRSIPGHEASGVVAGGRRGRHARQGRRQGRGLAVARLRPLRLLPRRPRAPVHRHALPRQREPLPARAGHVPGILRDGRAAVLSGRTATSRSASSRSPSRSRSACTASTAAATCSASPC